MTGATGRPARPGTVDSMEHTPGSYARLSAAGLRWAAAVADDPAVVEGLLDLADGPPDRRLDGLFALGLYRYDADRATVSGRLQGLVEWAHHRHGPRTCASYLAKLARMVGPDGGTAAVLVAELPGRPSPDEVTHALDVADRLDAPQGET